MNWHRHHVHLFVRRVAFALVCTPLVCSAQADEFGRTYTATHANGSSGHNNKGYTMWMAGGGVKPSFAYGQTDEDGWEAVDGRVHTHDMHATLLHLLGLDHERLTYRYAGRDFRLTDVRGRVVDEILT